MMEHIVTNKLMFDLTKVKKLERSRHAWTLPMLEMYHIANTDNTVNHRTDIDGINTAYAGILHTLKTNIHRSRKNQTQTPF